MQSEKSFGALGKGDFLMKTYVISRRKRLIALAVSVLVMLAFMPQMASPSYAATSSVAVQVPITVTVDGAAAANDEVAIKLHGAADSTAIKDDLAGGSVTLTVPVGSELGAYDIYLTDNAKYDTQTAKTVQIDNTTTATSIREQKINFYSYEVNHSVNLVEQTTGGIILSPTVDGKTATTAKSGLYLLPTTYKLVFTDANERFAPKNSLGKTGPNNDQDNYTVASSKSITIQDWVTAGTTPKAPQVFDVSSYTVTIVTPESDRNADGRIIDAAGNILYDQLVFDGDKVTKPAAPRYGNANFVGWYANDFSTDKTLAATTAADGYLDFEKAFNFDTPLTKAYFLTKTALTYDSGRGVYLNAAWIAYPVRAVTRLDNNQFNANITVVDAKVASDFRLGTSVTHLFANGFTSAYAYTVFDPAIDPENGGPANWADRATAATQNYKNIYPNGTYYVYDITGTSTAPTAPVATGIKVVVKDDKVGIVFDFYTVALNDSSVGATAHSDNFSTIVLKGQTVNLPPVPAKAGYTAKGWYTAKSGGTKVTSSVTKITKRTILYAQYTAKAVRVTVTFKANLAGAKVSNKASTLKQSYNKNGKIGKKGYKKGYTFKGWYTKAKGGTKVTKATKAQTLYAHWAKK
jgi:uncharacterized repeat protein (TIGR02543 family)